MNIAISKHIHMMNCLKVKKNTNEKNWLKLKNRFNLRTCVSAKGTPIWHHIGTP